MDQLRITEIFYSLQGETRTTGLPTVFVRLTGCPLRCTYCDTAYAFHGGDMQGLDSIFAEIEKHKTPYVTVTGGEPLAQKGCIGFMEVLCDKGYKVSLETSGAMDTSEVDSRVVTVLDLKTPGSGEVSRNMMSNLEHMQTHDQVKFVICNREDYEWSKQCVEEQGLLSKVQDVLFSPSYKELEAVTLAEWVLADHLNVRVQVQLHKQLWGDKEGV